MVKIESDLLDDAALRKMGIIVVNNEGGGYNYVPSQAATRAGSEFKEEIEEDMSKAAQIWKNKPGCWQDHFRRGKVFQHYGEFFDPQYGFEQTGYQLAIQTLMNTLSHRDGTYYDPKCFCLHPRDIIGQKLSCMSRLRLNQAKPFKYQYDETHLLQGRISDTESTKNPFISAALLNESTAGFLSLESDCLIPLFNTAINFPFHLEDVDDLCQYPPLILKPASNQWQYEIPIDEQRYWIYTPVKLSATGNITGVFKIIHETDAMPYKELVGSYTTYPIAFLAEFVGPGVANSMCGMGMLSILIANFAGGCVVGFSHTNEEPFWDVYWGTNQIGRVGTGSGFPIVESFFISPTASKAAIPSPSSFYDYPRAKPIGKQSYHPPSGKLTGPYTPSVTCGDRCDDCFGWNGIIYDYILDEPIDCLRNGPFTEFMFTMKVIAPSDRYGDPWYYYGACWLDLAQDTNVFGHVNLDWPTVIFDPSRYVHCIQSSLNFSDITKVRITVRSNPAFRSYTCSQVGVPGGRYECSADAGPSLWILERQKNQDD